MATSPPGVARSAERVFRGTGPHRATLLDRLHLAAALTLITLPYRPVGQDLCQNISFPLRTLIFPILARSCS